MVYARGLTPADFNYTPSGSATPVPIDPNTKLPLPGGSMAMPPTTNESTNVRQQPLDTRLPGAYTGNPALVYGAQSAVMDSTAAQLAAGQKYLNAQPAYTAAQSTVYDAKTAALDASRAYLNEQLRASQASMQMQQKIQAAKGNTSDIIAVGREQNLRNNTDYLYQLAGMKAPVDLQLPPDFQGELPPGTRMKLRTLGDILTEKANDQEVMNKFYTELARIHAANTGLAVTAAEIKAGRVKLTLDELQDAMQMAGLVTDQARLDLQRASRPPGPNLVWNQVKEAWTSPEVAEFDNKRYANQSGDARMGPLGSLDPSEAKGMAIRGSITLEQYRQHLIARDTPSSVADILVTDVQNIQNAQKTDSNATLIDALTKELLKPR